jgi:hypothetical protein
MGIRTLTRGGDERTVAKELRQIKEPQVNKSASWNCSPENIRAKNPDGSLLAINCENPNALMLFSTNPLLPNPRYIDGRGGIIAINPTANFAATSFGIFGAVNYRIGIVRSSINLTLNNTYTNSASQSSLSGNNITRNIVRNLHTCAFPDSSNPFDTTKAVTIQHIIKPNKYTLFGSYSINGAAISSNAPQQSRNINTIKSSAAPDFFRNTMQQLMSTVYGTYNYTESNANKDSNAARFLQYKINARK